MALETETSPVETEQSMTFGTRRFGAINWLGLWTLYQKEVRRFTKVAFQTVFAPIISTLLFLLVFMGAWGARGSGIEMEGVSLPITVFLPPGLIMMAIISNAFQNSSSTLIIAKVQGSIVDMLMPPLSPAELTLAIVAGAATRGLLVGFVTALTVSAFTWNSGGLTVLHLWAIVYFAVFAATLFGMVGAIAGMWAEKFDHNAAITNFVVAPLSLLSGTFYTIDRLQEPFYTISHVNPFFYVISGFRYGFIGQSDIAGHMEAGAEPVIWAAGGLLAFNAALALAVFALLKSGWKIRQ